ncbi:hypothetical protein [Brevibacillus choshinensis]|uniref:hypothetical protein n=1 Tax=Brevibacillus choshinensis TaxID=54911 RepID=UPI0006EC1024|nr:hypothetical protein [Brevibacillus choshinensis]
MNKKVVLSVLSTAVVASMAASAFAAPKDGLYIGGNVNKYYSTDVLLNMNAAAKAAYVNEVKSITDFNNLVFVDFSGKGASIQEILEDGLANAKAEALVKEDFATSYAVATVTGSTDGTYDARAAVDPSTPVGDLKVESVSAINTSGVEFKFAALTADIKGATVEVKDNNNNVVPVVAQDLVKGETSAAFDFVTALTTAPTGVWKVNGVSFNLDDVKKFDDIVAAAFSGNEVTTLSLLKAAGLTDIKDEQISNYVAAINTSTTKQTLADIQAIIKTVNDTALTGAEEKAITDAVNNATNQVQLLAALQNKAFKHVNADWIQQYKADIDAVKAPPAFGTTDTVIEIQAIVDAANIAKIGAANTAATTAAAQNAVTALIQAYMVDDATTPGALTPKADAIKASQIKAGVFKVKEATTQGTLYSALTALASLDSANLPAASLNGNLKAEYLTAKGTATITNTASVKSDIVDAGATAGLNAALTALDALTATATDAQVKAALQTVANVTAHETVAANKLDMSSVKDANLNKYLTDTTVGFDAVGGPLTLAEIQTAISTVNADAGLGGAVATVNATTSTTSNVRAALIDIAVAQSATGSKTVVDNFLSLSTQAQLEVAQLVIDNRPAAPGYVDAEAIVKKADGTGAIDTQVTAHAAQLAKFNAIDDLASATTANIKAALDDYAFVGYVSLTNTQKVAVAQEIGKLTKTSGTTTTPLNFGGTDAVKSFKQANDIITAAKTAAGI